MPESITAPVKILFVCGGLEAGRDGVGDYCRRIAAAGRALGWQPSLLAIHDPAVQNVEDQASLAGVPMLRLARGEAWSERQRRAAEFIAAQQPDWVSLQFVCYALEPNGVISRWVSRLGEMLAGRRVHLMFHEVWIGASTEYGIRERLVGRAQRRSIRRLAHRLRPSAMHTSNHLYQQLLAEIGLRAGRLRLPGNIPIATERTPVAGFPDVDRAKHWIGGIFGTIHPRWLPEPWLAESVRLAGERGRKLALVQFGEAGGVGRESWARLAVRYRDRVEFAILGPREPGEISRILGQLDFGVATSPWALIEKSGATAAFLDHGLPVLVTRDDWKLRAGYTADPAGDPLLFKSPAALFRALPMRSTPMDRVSEIARELARELVL